MIWKPETILKSENCEPEEPEEPEYYTTHLISGTQVCTIPPILWNGEFLKVVESTASQDEQYQAGQHSLEINPDVLPNYIKPSGDLTMDNNILYYKNCLYIPQELISTILKSEHNFHIAGVFTMDKTFELIRLNIWWPAMDKDITEYIMSCPDYKMDKSRHHNKYGLLSPLELPYAPWQSIAMDFITDSPLSNGYT